MTGLAAAQSLRLSRGWHPVWLGADLRTIVTHGREIGREPDHSGDSRPQNADLIGT